MDSLENLVNSLVGMGNDLTMNAISLSLVTIFLAMYGPRLSPKLPIQLRRFFSMPVFRGFVIFLILFLANRNLRLSLVLAVGFLALMNQVQHENTREFFSQYGQSLNHQSAYNNSEDHNLSYSMNSNDNHM